MFTKNSWPMYRYKRLLSHTQIDNWGYLSLESDRIMWGNQVVMPKYHQKIVLEELHQVYFAIAHIYSKANFCDYVSVVART